jgi:hypothetical protein
MNVCGLGSANPLKGEAAQTNDVRIFGNVDARSQSGEVTKTEA